MPEPLIAWAAVAPDGTIVRTLIRSTKEDAEWAIGEEAVLHDSLKDARCWQDAYRAGWRVVPVEIRVKEDGNG